MFPGLFAAFEAQPSVTVLYLLLGTMLLKVGLFLVSRLLQSSVFIGLFFVKSGLRTLMISRLGTVVTRMVLVVMLSNLGLISRVCVLLRCRTKVIVLVLSWAPTVPSIVLVTGMLKRDLKALGTPEVSIVIARL